MKFLFLEPFFGGSHKDFAEGLIRHSRHDIDLMTLPARAWKWRMRGAALHFSRKAGDLSAYDGLILSDLMSLSDFKALAGKNCPPALVYFHESQLTYPLAPGERMDFQYGFTDITTGLAADRILFNSRTHSDTFFSHLPGFIKMMPDYQPRWAVDAIREKSGVLHPGCHFSAEAPRLTHPETGTPPLIIWNHRWEFDKHPEAFFDALDAVMARGIAFRVALLGENFARIPDVFRSVREKYGDRVIQCGYLESKADYLNMLRRGHIVISTARQENFGISVIEAMRCGCLPLLPNRLSYPEILPNRFHGDFLYDDQAGLIEKLALLLSGISGLQKKREDLSRSMGKFAWETLIGQYDSILEDLGHL
ncbi:glycosyl transferase family 1 [Desulfonema ishimotonii]|uniref:tRNA-queuosine alpha-mannosyltransferase n=1 Tax=Desulfonema ishimotonii TaxID=45657 RepID=A0A401FQH5_9BACT|nr:DUF3524 domain-containing protein [Desulfonema ishimotonii]GBC59172.1 glycosyl transferase family 1 [Desulfonema ishimotonii]